MTQNEAQNFLDTLNGFYVAKRSPGGLPAVYRIDEDANGKADEVEVAKAAGWKQACRIAVKPILERKQREEAEARAAAEVKAKMEYEEFLQWKRSKDSSSAPAS